MKAVKYGIKSIGPDENGNIEPHRFIEFGKTRERDARALKAGDKMLVHVTGTAKVLGAAVVVGRHPYSESPHGDYPYRVRCRWIISVPESEGIKAHLLGIKQNAKLRPYQEITAGQFAEGLVALLKRSRAA